MSGSTGSAQGGFNATKLGALEIPVPPLTEQQRIVRILDEAFESIAQAKANTEKNLQNARALFESYMSHLFDDRKDWRSVPIGSVAKTYDGPHATPKTVDEGPIFLGISALQDGKVNLGETRHVTPEDFQRWTRRVKPQTNDIVFSYETRLGQAALIPPGLECCLGRRMGLVRVDQQRLLPDFFTYQYISRPFQKYLNDKTVRGATVDRIALKDFPSFLIALPTLDEQRDIVNRLERLHTQTNQLEEAQRNKLGALGELKESLLHQAFNGNL
jgi:type I restriction enzyme S subunit